MKTVGIIGSGFIGSYEDVRDVADAVNKAATISGIHGKNYLLSSETYTVSDLTLMLNGQKPKRTSKIIYQNGLAQRELKLSFRPVSKTLDDYNA